MRISIIILVLLVAAVAAHATPAPSTAGWTLTPVVNGASVSFLLGVDNAAALAGYDGSVSKTWGDPTLSDPSKFISLGQYGGVLRSLTLTLDGDPQFSLAFDYEAGETGNDVFIQKPVLTFGTIAHPSGTATAAITVTDFDGDGATATGAYTGGKFYDARYNTLSSAQDFAFLISGPVTASPYLSATKTQTTSPVWQPIGTPVSDMRSFFSFHLTANDEASGTSSFQIVPEPGSMMALATGLIGLVGLIRRRQR